MFRRKDESGEAQVDTDVLVEEDTPVNLNPTPAASMPAPRPAMPMAAATPAARPASPMAAQPYRPLSQASTAASPVAAPMSASSDFRPVPASPMASSSAVSSSAAAKANGKRVLTVGNDIILRGEIATCDRLVIEGAVDATLKEVHTVEIAEHGSFKGTAEIEDAEISGLFEGDLIVRNRLTIYSTGKVRGRIAYGEIEIERGGELSGDITFGRPEANARSKRSAA